MHPSPAFCWDDRAEMRAFAEAIGFGALFAATPDGPRVAHLPLVFLGEEQLGFHIARGNQITRHLDGQTALFVVQGPDAYVSPDWYGLPDQVPTWNYLAVELEGTVRSMDQDALIDQVDRLSAAQEAALAPKTPWVRDKMRPGLFERLLKGITGFTLDITAWRGTRKLGQNKSETARIAVADALDARGLSAMATLMRDAAA